MPVVDPDLLMEANRFKDQLLIDVFGVLPQAASGGPAALTAVIPAQSNILGVGYGAKITNGTAIEELAVRIYVRAKLPTRLLLPNEIIPSMVRDPLTNQERPTDILPVGDLVAFWPRPTQCGVSVGHYNLTAGTLGCLVARNNPINNDVFILSNNHVLADSTSLPPGTAPPMRDNILEPGPIDGGNANPPIAELTDWEPINFAAVNTMDAAIARVIVSNSVLSSIHVIGSVAQNTTPAKLYQSVRKHGRTTLHTVGVIMDLSARIKVRYGTRLATFDNQLAIVGAGGSFSSGGDSGSLIVDGVTKEPVALLFAGGGGTTFGNPIDQVLARFNVRIL